MLEGLHDPKTLPEVSETSAPYFAAAARGELCHQRCDACAHAFLYPRALCPACHGNQLSWEVSAGRGEVVSCAPVHRPPWNEFARPVPYTIVLVRLDEGPQLLSTLEHIDPADVAIGARVQAAYERVRDDLGLVRFVCDTGHGGD